MPHRKLEKMKNQANWTLGRAFPEGREPMQRPWSVSMLDGKEAGRTE